MTGPRLTILGVYRPQISRETWREQWQATRSDDATRRHFENLVLIEAAVQDLKSKLKMGKFGQEVDIPGFSRHMQVGYDEGLLSADGEELIERKMNCVEGSGTLRFAVYLHFYDPAQPIKWEFGEVECPRVRDVPVRLMHLMPYRACR